MPNIQTLSHPSPPGLLPRARHPLALAVCLGLTSLSACDPEPGEAVEVTAQIVESDDRAADHHVAPATHREPSTPDDECGLAHDHDPLRVSWTQSGGPTPLLEIQLRHPLEIDDEVEVQFRGSAMPVDEAGVRDWGPALTVEHDAAIPMPSSLVAAAAGGEALAAFAIVTVCTADDPQGNCQLYNSGELYLEDGRAMLPGEHQEFLRAKWFTEKPWLFENGEVTNIIDMKGR